MFSNNNYILGYQDYDKPIIINSDYYSKYCFDVLDINITHFVFKLYKRVEPNKKLVIFLDVLLDFYKKIYSGIQETLFFDINCIYGLNNGGLYNFAKNIVFIDKNNNEIHVYDTSVNSDSLKLYKQLLEKLDEYNVVINYKGCDDYEGRKIREIILNN